MHRVHLMQCPYLSSLDAKRTYMKVEAAE